MPPRAWPQRESTWLRQLAHDCVRVTSSEQVMAATEVAPESSGGCGRRRPQTLSLDNACTSHNAQRWHVLRDHGARADDRATTDGHSRCDRGRGADPDIILKEDRGMRDEVVPLI